jgi:hypothetical protein
MTIDVMKALRFAAFGSPSVLRIEQVPIPEPGEGEALVRLKAAAINPGDIAEVAGRFEKTTLPHQAWETQLSIGGVFCRIPWTLSIFWKLAITPGPGTPRATETQK